MVPWSLSWLAKTNSNGINSCALPLLPSVIRKFPGKNKLCGQCLSTTNTAHGYILLWCFEPDLNSVRSHYGVFRSARALQISRTTFERQYLPLFLYITHSERKKRLRTFSAQHQSRGFRGLLLVFWMKSNTTPGERSHRAKCCVYFIFFDALEHMELYTN